MILLKKIKLLIFLLLWSCGRHEPMPPVRTGANDINLDRGNMEVVIRTKKPMGPFQRKTNEDTWKLNPEMKGVDDWYDEFVKTELVKINNGLELRSLGYE